jgi:hypothetical protein
MISDWVGCGYANRKQRLGVFSALPAITPAPEPAVAAIRIEPAFLLVAQRRIERFQRWLGYV